MSNVVEGISSGGTLMFVYRIVDSELTEIRMSSKGQRSRRKIIRSETDNNVVDADAKNGKAPFSILHTIVPNVVYDLIFHLP